MEPKVYHRSAKTGGRDNWETPQALYETLDREFGFTLDAAANGENAKTDLYLGESDIPGEDGLSSSWGGHIVFCNPPYSQIKNWAKKANLEALGGALVVMVVPARTGAAWFRENMAPWEVRFLTKRLKFEENGEPGAWSAPFDSAVIVMARGREPKTYYWDWENDPPPGSEGGRERPSLRYYGGKFSLAPWIIDHFPGNYRELHYIEPYGGSAAVLLRKEPSLHETYNDLSGDLVTFFRVLRDRPRELMDRLRVTPYARAEYQMSFFEAENDLETARRFFVRHWQSIPGAADRPGWKVQRDPSGRYGSAPGGFIRALENLYHIAGRLRAVQIENIPALDLIRKADSPGSLFYIDPPYLSETRAAPRSYSFELSEEDHRELGETLGSLSGYAILSGYESSLYRDLYGARGWIPQARKVRTNSNGKAEEILWLNPRLAEELGLEEGEGVSNL